MLSNRIQKYGILISYPWVSSDFFTTIEISFLSSLFHGLQHVKVDTDGFFYFGGTDILIGRV